MAMDPEIEYKYQRLRSFFFGLCILASSLLFLITGKNILKTLEAENWSVYPGQVEASGQSGGFYFGTSLLRYSYEIDGKKYEGSRTGYGISNLSEVNVAEKSIRVYVNPDNPAEAVLATGIRNTHLIGLLFSGLFFWLAFYLWRKTK